MCYSSMFIQSLIELLLSRFIEQFLLRLTGDQGEPDSNTASGSLHFPLHGGSCHSIELSFLIIHEW